MSRKVYKHVKQALRLSLVLVFALPIPKVFGQEPEMAQISLGGIIRSNGSFGLYYGDAFEGNYDANCDGSPLPDIAVWSIPVGEPAPLSLYVDECSSASSLKLLSCNLLFLKKIPQIYTLIKLEIRGADKSKVGYIDPDDQLNRYLKFTHCLNGRKVTLRVDSKTGEEEEVSNECVDGCLGGFYDGSKFWKTKTITNSSVYTVDESENTEFVGFYGSGEYNKVRVQNYTCDGVDDTYSGSSSFSGGYYDLGGTCTGTYFCSATVNSSGQWEGNGSYSSAGCPDIDTNSSEPITRPCISPGEDVVEFSNELIPFEADYDELYTTEKLISNTIASFPDEYRSGGYGAGAHLNVYGDELSCSASEARYSIYYRPYSTESSEQVALRWVERFVPEDGVPVTSVQIVDGGYGYTSAPNILISHPGGQGTPAQAVATVAGGKIISVSLTHPGAGYKSGLHDFVVASGGGGQGAVLLLRYGTETERSAVISSTPPANYDPYDSTTFPYVGPFNLAVPDTEGTTVVANVHIPPSPWKRLDQSAQYQLETKGGSWLLMAMPSGGESAAGECTATLGSVDFKVDLGPSPEGYSFGKLRLYANTINASSASRAQWALSTTLLAATDVEQLTGAGGLRQLVSPSGLVDLRDAAGGCDIRFYTPTDYHPKQGGLYPLKAGAVPYVTYEIRDTTSAGIARLLMREHRPGASSKYHLYGQQTGDIWSLEQGALGPSGALLPASRTTRSPLTVSGRPAHQFVEEDFTYNPGPLTTIRRTFTKDAEEPYKSRNASIDYPDGKRVSYDYVKGYFYTWNGVFTASEWGSDLLTTETTGRAFVLPELVAGRSTRTATITDYEGRTRQSTLLVYDGTTFATVEQTRFSYDYEGNLLSQTRNGRTAYAAQYTAGRMDWETDETGIKTTYAYWPEGTYVTSSGKQPVMTRTKAAVPAHGEYPAQGEITTTYYYEPDGNGDVYVSTEELSGGGQTLITSRTQDTEGRLTSSQSQGLTTTYIYDTLVGGGLRTTTTLPSGGTEIREEDDDGRTLRVSGTATVAEYHTYTKSVEGHDVHTVYYGSSTEPTATYLSTVTDAKGRRLREVRPAYHTATTAGVHERTFYYDTRGLLVRETTTGLADTLYIYDDFGELLRSGYDTDGDGQLTLASTDKLRQAETIYQQDGGDWYRVSTTKIPYADNSATLTTVSQYRDRLTLPVNTLRDTTVINEAGVQTRAVTTVNLPLTLVEEVITKSGVTGQTLRVTRNGLLQSEQAASQTAPVRYAYDGLGRPSRVTPPAGPATVRTYTDDGLPESTTLLSADETQSLVESFTYHPQGSPGAGQVATRTTATQVVRYAYDLNGRLLRQWGASYPVRFTYDFMGSLETLETYRETGFDLAAASWPAGDVTTWVYHPATRQLISKKDANNESVGYVYWPSGLLKTRTWARGLVTTYGFTNAGELQSITYSDDTPSVAHTYDRAGRLLTTTDAAGLLTRAYETGVLVDEIYSSTGLLSGRTIERGLDAHGRVESLATDIGYALGYTYDSTGRLDELTQGTHLAKYGYKANVGTVETVTIQRQGVERLIHHRIEDELGRLETVRTTTGGLSPVERDYRYNASNQRDRIIHEDGRRWHYSYDDLGQVVSGQKRLSDDTTVLPGYSFGYDFDRIGNREETTVNGRVASYTPSNQLNQIVSRQVPAAVDVRGEALATASVTVEGQPSTRTDKNYYREVGLSNNSAPAKARLTITATAGSQTVTETRAAFLPQTPEAFAYDLDGNLKLDGQWSYTWDGENRLIGMVTRPDVATASGIIPQRLTFAYDAQGRRIHKKVELYNQIANTWAQVVDKKFIYDGWNLLAELRLNPSTSTYTLGLSYAWGLDMSETLQGAGGVGGLLWANLNEQTFAASADANGNIVAYVNTETQAVAGRLDYGAFGEPVMKTGVAAILPYGFSSKYTDSETGLLYYGFRYYNPSTGRWPNRDPIEENGGLNLYGFVGNNAINYWDYLGQDTQNAPAMVPNGDFAFNEIITHFFQGHGSGFYREDDRWTAYMKNGSRHFRGAARDRIITIVRSSGLRPTDRWKTSKGKATFSQAIYDSATMGKRTGYYLMNGPNPYVLVNYDLVVGDDCNLRGRVRFSFFDKMDRNINPFKYPITTVIADLVHGTYSEIVTLGAATDFDLIISWESDIFVEHQNGSEFATGNPRKTKGWPLDE